VFNSQAICHEDIKRSRAIAPTFVTSALYEVNGQLHAPAALPTVRIGRMAVGSQNRSGCCIEGKNLAVPRIEFSLPVLCFHRDCPYPYPCFVIAPSNWGFLYSWPCVFVATCNCSRKVWNVMLSGAVMVDTWGSSAQLWRSPGHLRSSWAALLPLLVETRSWVGREGELLLFGRQYARIILAYVY
jgi:hypothetical protein